MVQVYRAKGKMMGNAMMRGNARTEQDSIKCGRKGERKVIFKLHTNEMMRKLIEARLDFLVKD